MNKKMIISWILVIIWLMVIFMFSSMNSEKSNEGSEGIIYSIVSIVCKDNNKVDKIVRKINIPFRKFCHFSEYFILAILLLIAFKNSNIVNNIYWITLLLCFLYASLDEFHQLFVSGRSGQFMDVMIDTTGSIVAIIIWYFYKKK